MDTLTWAILTALAVIVVAAQPVLGWSAIPKFFEYSTVAAICLGIFDAALIFTPTVAFFVFNLNR